VDDFEQEKGGVRPAGGANKDAPQDTINNHNQSFLDEQEKSGSEQEAISSGTSYLVYAIVSVFMIGSVSSTAFIVKKYMLSTSNISYTRPTEDDTYEFDNLLSNENEQEEFLFDDDSDEQREDDQVGFQVDNNGRDR
jgi:hypothetical protein